MVAIQLHPEKPGDVVARGPRRSFRSLWAGLQPCSALPQEVQRLAEYCDLVALLSAIFRLQRDCLLWRKSGKRVGCRAIGPRLSGGRQLLWFWRLVQEP